MIPVKLWSQSSFLVVAGTLLGITVRRNIRVLHSSRQRSSAVRYLVIREVCCEHYVESVIHTQHGTYVYLLSVCCSSQVMQFDA